METAEDPEKRFERAMERLFSGSPPTPAARYVLGFLLCGCWVLAL